MTEDELAQALADHFKPPHRYESYEYIRDENGRVMRDPDTGWMQIRYFERDDHDTPDSPAMSSRRMDDGEISFFSLTYRDIARALLETHDITPKEAHSEHPVE